MLQPGLRYSIQKCWQVYALLPIRRDGDNECKLQPGIPSMGETVRRGERGRAMLLGFRRPLGRVSTRSHRENDGKHNPP